MSVAGGPRVVAIGGGHGLAASLRAIRRYAGDITAVVSVADDGGSSGRLRQLLSMPAPGDLRRCLSALANPESRLGAALEYRFPTGDLAGHALGNLLIAGLAEADGGFVGALDEVGRLVGSVGRVLPATTEPVTLMADAGCAAGIEGQVAVQNTAGIRRLTIRPASATTPPEVLAAITAADQVVIGPGSLFTSVLAAAIVPAIRSALCDVAVPRVYVCNLGPQSPETDGLSAADHAEALVGHGVPIDVMVCHPGPLGCRAEQQERLGGLRCLEREVAHPGGAAHDSALLAAVLAELLGAG